MVQKLIIVSLGPGDPGLMNSATVEAIRGADNLFLRTAKHPAAEWLKSNNIPFLSFDFLYENCEDFSVVYDNIADTIWTEAERKLIVYCVPDPAYDLSVFRICEKKPPQAELECVPGTGLTAVYLSKACAFTGETGLYSVAAAEFSPSVWNPAVSALITEINDGITAGEIKEKLSRLMDDEDRVFFFPDTESFISIPLYELDRQVSFSHLSAVFIPGSFFLNRNHYVLGDLLDIMKKLREPGGCPWDGKQTHDSLKTYMIEEAWECVAAIEQEDFDHLSDELGDLLFQIVFHADIGRSYDEFTMDDVLNAICRKMIRRHPHVFSDIELSDLSSIRREWEAIKRSENGNRTVGESLDSVSSALPSLKYAARLIQKAKQVPAFDREVHTVFSDIFALLHHIQKDDDLADDKNTLADILFFCVELCCISGQDAELLLHAASDRFKKRFQLVEKAAGNDGKTIESLTFDEVGVYLKYVEGEIE